MTRKAPTGARHASCLSHVPHGYASTGWLCVTTNTVNAAWPLSAALLEDGKTAKPGRPDRDMQPVDRAADMVAFADHLAAVAARHRVTSTTARPIVQAGADGAHAYVRRETVDGEPVAGPSLAECDWRRPVLSSQLPIGPAERVACEHVTAADIPCVLPRWHWTDHVAADGTRTSYAGIVTADTRRWPSAHYDGTVTVRRTAADADTLARMSAELSARLGKAPAFVAGASYSAAPVPVPAPVRKVRARKAPAPVQPAPVDPVAEPAPAPTLSAVPAPVDGRPTCPRCGQTFRKSGAGLAWHLTNRPDCAGPIAATTLSVAS